MQGENAMRKFKFYMSEPELKGYYSSEVEIPDCDTDLQEELDYLLEQFKCFLRLVGYSDVTISRLQYLEDEEWKSVLSAYGEWNEACEKLYQFRNKQRTTND